MYSSIRSTRTLLTRRTSWSSSTFLTSIKTIWFIPSDITKPSIILLRPRIMIETILTIRILTIRIVTIRIVRIKIVRIKIVRIKIVKIVWWILVNLGSNRFATNIIKCIRNTIRNTSYKVEHLKYRIQKKNRRSVPKHKARFH